MSAETAVQNTSSNVQAPKSKTWIYLTGGTSSEGDYLIGLSPEY